MLSINDEEEGVRILKEVQRYLLDKTQTRYRFDLTVLFADNDGEIARVDMDQIIQGLGHDGAAIPLRLIAVNYNHYEPLFLQNEIDALFAQQEEVRSPKRSLPAYVVNIPMKIDSDNEGESSSGEEDNEVFRKRMFRDPSEYFRLFPPPEKKEKTRRGAIVNKISLVDASIKSPDKGRLKRLVDLFEAEASQLNHSQKAPGRLGITIGFNKMRSLSRRRNRTIVRCVNEPTKTTLPLHKIGFLWDGVWQKRTSSKGNWQNASYEDVRSFYRQLKKKESRPS